MGLAAPAPLNIAPSLARLARFDQFDRLGLVLLCSISAHLLLVFGLNFKAPEVTRSPSIATLEVVLVNSKSASRPLKADALAQANLDGGGNTDAERRAKSPLPVMEQHQTDGELARKQQQVSRMENEARALLTRVKATQQIERLPSLPKTSDIPADTPNVADMVSRSMQIARMEAQIDRDLETYQKKPKRRFVGARAMEYRDARYIEDWRQKVEKVGNLNYPEAARQQKLYGSLRMTVSIKSDGSVEKIEINRSSGHPVLDQAAKRIVQLASPYAPFPEDIRKDTDILGITRTWSFTRADELGTSSD